jgi:hypothetical protein
MKSATAATNLGFGLIACRCRNEKQVTTAVNIGSCFSSHTILFNSVMPKKQGGVNTKVAAANERKAAAQADKDKKKAQVTEEREAADWSSGSKGKSKKDQDAEKKVRDRINY